MAELHWWLLANIALGHETDLRGALVRNKLFFYVQQASHSTRPRPQRAECRLPAGLSLEEPSFLSQHNFVFMSACASAAFANVALGHKQGLTVLLHDLHPPGP